MSSAKIPNQPGSDGIGKRSKSEELEQPEPKRSCSNLQVSTAAAEREDDSRTTLEFPASILESSGLYTDKEKLVLYRRENFKELFRFLHGVLHRRQDHVYNNPYQLGWILGPPGVGKSSAVFAFTRSPLVSEWAVTWIHSSHGGKQFMSVHRDNTGTKTEKFTSNQREEYMTKLKVENQQHLLVFDGFTDDTSYTMLSASEFWLEADFEKRRLVVICSRASRGRTSDARDMGLGVEQFKVCSWTLKEYKAAVTDPRFYNAVKEKLGTEADKSRDEVVESKYYFAGGSARFMFQMDTEEVKQDLHNAIENVSDIRTLAAGLTGCSYAPSEHLFSFHRGWRRGIVSQYAGNRLAAKLGTGLVRQFTCIWEKGRPTKGFLFEVWFFAKLSREGLSYDLIDGGPGKTWAKSNSVYLPSKEDRLVRESPSWFQPAWNNGGFDAVYVDPQKKTVRFVQITLNKHHSFKIHLFYKFLSRLRNYMHTETVEIFFVYPKGAVPQKPETTGEGLLTEFQWKNGEEWEKVTKVTLEWPGDH